MTKKDGKPCVRCGTNEWNDWGGCYECRRVSSRKYKQKYPKKAEAINKKWRANNPDAVAEMNRRYERRNPEKKKAHLAVNRAVSKGELPHVSTYTCSMKECNKQAQEYHHHKGYAEKHRLDVIPVCAKCHRILDAKS